MIYHASSRRIGRRAQGVALAAFLVAFTVPSANAFGLTPPTKSFEEERAVAAQQHPQILAQFNGEYDDPELSAYVTRVGERVARASDMPDKPFTFTVLNSPVVNAFTVGGGYVYVTRGILASINSESLPPCSGTRSATSPRAIPRVGKPGCSRIAPSRLGLACCRAACQPRSWRRGPVRSNGRPIPETRRRKVIGWVWRA